MFKHKLEFVGEDRLTRRAPAPGGPKRSDESGPSAPKVERPGGDNELTRRLKRVDPDQAKRYRQRSGE